MKRKTEQIGRVGSIAYLGDDELSFLRELGITDASEVAEIEINRRDLVSRMMDNGDNDDEYYPSTKIRIPEAKPGYLL